MDAKRTLADRLAVSTDLGMDVVVSVIVDLLKRIPKIVSGGQTGADRAALDWALSHNLPCGGWCPKGRKAEDGMIDSNPAERIPISFLPSTNRMECPG
jgi:hypothetical protein